MADIVDLAIERGYRLGRERTSESNSGPAQIVLYTGVRYERAGPPQPTNNKPKKRKPKNKNS